MDASHGGDFLNNINSRLISTSSLSNLRPSRHDSNPVPKILLFSALDTQALQRLTEDYTKHFQKAIDTPQAHPQYLNDLAYTLDTRRSSFVTNAFCVANSDEDLRSFGEKISKPVQRLQDLKLGFVFTGQGAQWHAMGRELLAMDAFKTNILRMEEYLTSLGCSWSLLGMCTGSYSAREKLTYGRRTHKVQR
jgi:acyl transferase domain-containing protein